jgi:hypothetical protein
MNHFDLEKQLKTYKESDTTMSPLVRARLNEVYTSIADSPAKPAKRPPRTWKHRTTIAATAATVLGIAVFASGFVSPVMAQSIRSIPLIGTIFESVGQEFGIQRAVDSGLYSTADSTVSYQDIKLHVSETVFDGERALFALNVSSPQLKNGVLTANGEKIELQNAIHDFNVKINDKVVGENGFYFGGGEKHPNTLILEQMFDSTSAADLPDSINAELSITIEGINHEFKLDVPLTKSTKNIVHLEPKQTLTNDSLSFTLSEVDITPITTNVQFSLSALGKTKLSEDEEMAFMTNYQLAVYDDKGNLLSGLNGNREMENNEKGNKATATYNFASAQQRPSYLVFKLFRPDGNESFPYASVKDSQLIAGMSIKVDIPTQ